MQTQNDIPLNRKLYISSPWDFNAHIIDPKLKNALTGYELQIQVRDLSKSKKIILDSNIDLHLCALDQIPLTLPEGFVIAGLSERINAHDLLIFNPKYEGKNLHDEGTQLLTCSLSKQGQLQYLFSEASISISEEAPYKVLETLSDTRYAAVVLPARDIEIYGFDISKLKVKTLNVKEFVPSAGQGVLAYITRHDNIALRKALINAHHPNVAICTNVERGLMQMLDDRNQMSTAIHCFQDEQGNYHGYLCCANADEKLQKHQLRQTTIHGMAERLYKMIEK